MAGDVNQRYQAPASRARAAIVQETPRGNHPPYSMEIKHLFLQTLATSMNVLIFFRKIRIECTVVIYS